MADQSDTRITLTLGALCVPAHQACLDLKFETVQDLLRTALRAQLIRWGRLGEGKDGS